MPFWSMAVSVDELFRRALAVQQSAPKQATSCSKMAFAVVPVSTVLVREAYKQMLIESKHRLPTLLQLTSAKVGTNLSAY